MQKIIIASGPVIVNDGKVLLNQHGDDVFWKFCGGRVENFDVNLIEAAKRETKEEIGIEINILSNQPYIMHVIKNSDTDVILVHYLAEIKFGEVIELGKDIRKSAWLEISSLNEKDLAPNILPALKHFGFIK